MNLKRENPAGLVHTLPVGDKLSVPVLQGLGHVLCHSLLHLVHGLGGQRGVVLQQGTHHEQGAGQLPGDRVPDPRAYCQSLVIMLHSSFIVSCFLSTILGSTTILSSLHASSMAS